jgi:PAS domain S-box-containing protein
MAKGRRRGDVLPAAEDGMMLDRLRSTWPSRCNFGFMTLAAAGLGGCYALSQINYLLFHTLVELSAVIVSCAVFIFFWNTRRYLDNGFFLFIAVACLVTGALDLTHALAYPGVSIIPGATGNQSIQAKTVGRWICSLSFLIAPLFLRRKINLPVTIAAYGAVLVLVIAAIFRWHILPTCYVPGGGMADFEQLARGINGALFLAAAALLARKRSALDAGVFRLLFAALMVNTASEFMSAVSRDFYGSVKVLAHLSQVVSLYLIYRALVNVSLTKLCDLAFRDLKQSQDALRKERDFFAVILKTTGATVAVLDPEGRLVRYEPGSEDRGGYCPDEVLGKYVWDCFTSPEDRDANKAIFAQLGSSAVPSRRETAMVAKDGRRLIVQWTAVGLRNAEGDVECVAATAVDMTGLRQAEESRARSLRRLAGVNRLQEELLLPASLEEKFKKITNAAVELIDLDFCRIWMVEPGDLCNTGCVHAAATEEGHQCRRRDKCLHLIVSSGRYTHIDGGHRRVPLGAYKIGRIAADTEKKFLTNSVTTDPRVADHQWAKTLGLVSFAGYRLHDARGNTTGVLAAFAKHPISEESDAFLANLADTTSKVIVDRHAGDELRQSQKLEGIGQLAGGIAHEFNNLLQVIGGYTRCVLDELPPDQPAHGDLAQVLKAADRAAALTRQLLGFSRRSAIQPKSTDANTVVRDLAKLVQPLIGEHIALKLALGENVGNVYADAGELQQALLNLCVNARDAMGAPANGHSGGTLVLKTGRAVVTESHWGPDFELAPGTYIVFSVSDTGCGIPREILPRVFEPFFTTKEVGKGSGLGLAMVHGIMRQHKGAVHVYSEVSTGTTFRLYLPVGDDQPAEQNREEPLCIPLGNETILIAEDDPTVRKITIRTLKDAGYTVLAACDGLEAVRMFQEHRDSIALVLLDVVMPKMSGHEAHRRIRDLAPETKVVFCTGYDRDTVQCDGLVGEGLPLVQKPFTAQALLSVVREVLDAPAPCQAT